MTAVSVIPPPECFSLLGFISSSSIISTRSSGRISEDQNHITITSEIQRENEKPDMGAGIAAIFFSVSFTSVLLARFDSTDLLQHMSDIDVYGFDVGVVCQRVLSQLAANCQLKVSTRSDRSRWGRKKEKTRTSALLETTKRNIGVQHVCAVNPNCPGL